VAKDFLDGLIHDLLDCDGIRLTLPAVICRSVVRDCEHDISHVKRVLVS
jgi:hypothetical protein